MKSIMLSVQPQWLAKILNGEKTVEIRKTVPRELPCEVYLYCTKKERLVEVIHKGENLWGEGTPADKTVFIKMPSNFLSLPLDSHGKVLAKFTLKNVTKWSANMLKLNSYKPSVDILERISCLNDEDLKAYAKGSFIYAWQIDNLVVFDEPMELKQFGTWDAKRWHENGTHWFPLNRAPQSWQYVEVLK